MTPQETEALRLLGRLGFRGIKIVGQVGDQIRYTDSDGEPVVDAPLVRVTSGVVRLDPWMAGLP